jgi:hypothetical protein
MQLEQATRKKARIRLGLQGPSGSGKTYSALLLAYGLCHDWSSIAVIDTEYGSASLYSHLGPFKTIRLAAPFSPEKYCDAISICEQAGIEVIIIDSCSHEWDGAGGVLDIHSSMSGNSFTNWGKVTPRHNNFVQAILQSPCHIICNIRSKQDYVLTDKNGKMVPERIGLKGVQRDGIEYELTTVFELDIKHFATATKDRTSLFINEPPFKLDRIAGEKLKQWCEQGEADNPVAELIRKIDSCSTVDDLLKLYTDSSAYQESLLSEFSRRRKQLQINEAVIDILKTNPITENGQRPDQA